MSGKRGASYLTKQSLSLSRLSPIHTHTRARTQKSCGYPCSQCFVVCHSLCAQVRQMGGGNGQKAKMARERAQEKLKGAKGSQLESNKKAMSIQCKVCMQTFMCTTNEVKCREHAEAKHPKTDLYQCFPHLKP